jgi:hypothetical protein
VGNFRIFAVVAGISAFRFITPKGMDLTQPMVPTWWSISGPFESSLHQIQGRT